MKRKSAIETLRTALIAGRIVDANSFRPMFRKEQIQPYLSRMYKDGIVEIVARPVLGSKGHPAKYKLVPYCLWTSIDTKTNSRKKVADALTLARRLLQTQSLDSLRCLLRTIITHNREWADEYLKRERMARSHGNHRGARHYEDLAAVHQCNAQVIAQALQRLDANTTR